MELLKSLLKKAMTPTTVANLKTLSTNSQMAETIEGLKLLGILKPEYGNTRSTHYRVDKERAKELADSITEVVNGKQESRISFD